MANGLSLNLQLMQNLTTSSNLNGNQAQNNKPALYAKEGEPRYDEAMDYDGDGVVTMDEYQKYLEENSVSTTEQAQNVQSLGDSMISKQLTAQTKAQEQKFDYDEYMQYCEANAVSQPSTQAAIKPENIETNEAGLIIHNFGKAINSYSRNNLNFATTNIERNA